VLRVVPETRIVVLIPAERIVEKTIGHKNIMRM